MVTKFSSPKSALVAEFIETYENKAKGNYKHLRTLHPKGDETISWDIIRNRELNKLKEQIAANDSKLFRDDGSLSTEHLQLIHWAYSPQADKVKSLATSGKVKNDRKRKSSVSSSDSDDSEPTPSKKQKSKA